jgi:hypothetical protein
MPIWIALLGNALIAIATVAVLGWNAAGALSAARNTARFSSLWCVAALASPAFFRLFRNLRESQLIHAFVAAHAVHFASVAALLLIFPPRHIAQHPVQSAIVIALGSSIIVGLGLTATATRSLYAGVRSSTLYTASLVFFLAFFRHALKPLRGIAVMLAVALVMRITSSFTFGSRGDRATQSPT